jgi:hypothetical protein
VAADRGYGEASVDDDLTNLGVRNVVIPRKDRPTKARQATERRRSFRQTVKWRTGCEGRDQTPVRDIELVAAIEADDPAGPIGPNVTYVDPQSLVDSNG